MTTETQGPGSATTQAGDTQTTTAIPAATTTTTGADEAAAAAAAAATAAAASAAAGETDYKFDVPEGIELDKASTEEFVAIAKELKLPQDVAQKLVNLETKRIQAQGEAHTKLVASWVEQVEADKEIGGDKHDENIGIAKAAIDAFGSPELKDALNASGFGNHPAFVRAFYRIGKAVSPDGFVPGGGPGGADDAAKRMYPSMK